MPNIKQYDPKFDELFEGMEIGFRKGKRYVRGIYKSQEKAFFNVVLLTDYLGKNDDWFAGETKTFSKGEAKKLTILSRHPQSLKHN